MHQVTVVVGFNDHTWRELDVEVPEGSTYALDVVEVGEEALELAKRQFSREEVAFWLVTYVESLVYSERVL